MKRLKEFSTYNTYNEVISLDKIADTEVEVMAVRFREGKYGEYCFMDVKLENGNIVSVITGSKIIMEALQQANEAKALPVLAKFTKKGRAWIVE